MTSQCLWVAVFVMFQVQLVLCRSTVKPYQENKAIEEDFMLFSPLQASVAKTIDEYISDDLGYFVNKSASSTNDEGFMLFSPLQASVAKTIDEYISDDLGNFINKSVSSTIYQGHNIFRHVQASVSITMEEYLADNGWEPNNKSASPSKIYEAIDENLYKNINENLRDKLQEELNKLREKWDENQEKIANFNRKIGNIKFNFKKKDSENPPAPLVIGGVILSFVIFVYLCCCCCCKICCPKEINRRPNPIIIPNKEWETGGMYKPPVPGTVPPMQQHSVPDGWTPHQNTYAGFNVQSLQQHPPSYEQARQQNIFPTVHSCNIYINEKQ